jgi:hypothetical protein
MKTTHRLRLILTSLLLLVTQSAKLCAEDLKLIDFYAGVSYPLVERDGKLSVRIPVRVVDKALVPDLKKLRIQRRDLYSADARPEKILQSITIAWEVDDKPEEKNGPTPALVITAALDALPPGSYTLALDLGEEDKDKKQPQPVALTLTRSPATLVSTRAVNLWQERWPWDTDSSSGYINLHEDAGKASAQGLTFIESRNLPTKPGPATGTLTFKPETTLVPAGGELRISVEPQGDFPLGKTTGKILVRSPQLPKPVEVDYEVNNVRTRAWILVCGIFGAFLGWLLRDQLKGSRDYIAARISVSEVLAVLSKSQLQIIDSEFRQALANAAQTLQAAAQTGTAAQITSAVTQAKTELTDAETSLKERHKLLSDALLPLYELLHRSWDLPPSVAEALRPAVAAADAIHSLVGIQSVIAGQARFDAEMPDLIAALANAGSRWRASCAMYLTALGQHPPALREQGDVRLNEAVAEWKRLFGDARDYVIVSRDELSKELEAAHAAYQRAKSHARDIKADGGELALWTRSLFPLPADAAACDELVAFAETLAQHVSQALDQPEESRTVPLQTQQDQKAAWEKVLTGVIKAGDPTPVKTAIAQGQWSAAAKLAAPLAVPPAAPALSGLGTPLSGGAAGGGAGGQAPAAPAAPVVRGFGFEAIANPGSGSHRSAEGLAQPVALSGSIAERVALAKEGKLMAFIQSAITTALYIAAAYVLYADTWIGNERDLMNVVAWGFSLDLTVAALTTTLGKFTPPK